MRKLLPIFAVLLNDGMGTLILLQVKVLLEVLDFLFVKINGGHQIWMFVLFAIKDIDVALRDTPVSHRSPVDMVQLVLENTCWESLQRLFNFFSFFI